MISALPVTDKISSTVTVPPLESIIRFPDDVSISLSPVTPIRILSIVAPPFTSRVPVTVRGDPSNVKFELSCKPPLAAPNVT